MDHCLTQTNSRAGIVSNHSGKLCNLQEKTVCSQGNLDKNRLVQHTVVPGGWVGALNTTGPLSNGYTVHVQSVND